MKENDLHSIKISDLEDTIEKLRATIKFSDKVLRNAQNEATGMKKENQELISKLQAVREDMKKLLVKEKRAEEESLRVRSALDDVVRRILDLGKSCCC